MMHAILEKALPDVLDGTLAPDRQRALDAHLAACDACREEYALELGLRDRLEALALAAPEGVLRELAADRAPLPVPRPRAPRLAAGVAVLALIVAGGVGALRLRAPAEVPPVAVAPSAPPAAPAPAVAAAPQPAPAPVAAPVPPAPPVPDARPQRLLASLALAAGRLEGRAPAGGGEASAMGFDGTVTGRAAAAAQRAEAWSPLAVREFTARAREALLDAAGLPEGRGARAEVRRCGRDVVKIWEGRKRGGERYRVAVVVQDRRGGAEVRYWLLDTEGQVFASLEAASGIIVETADPALPPLPRTCGDLP